MLNMSTVPVPDTCPKCGGSPITRTSSGECYFGCAAAADDERVERHWNTQGPDATGKLALRELLSEVRSDERQRIAREILGWCDDPEVFDKVAEKSVHAVRAVAYSVRDPEWVKRLKYEVR